MHRIGKIMIVEEHLQAKIAVLSSIKTFHRHSEVTLLDNHENAWEKIDGGEAQPDIVIANVGRHHRGVELIRKIHEKYPRILTILISGLEEPYGHRAHIFLMKPFDRAGLMTAFKKALEKHKP